LLAEQKFAPCNCMQQLCISLWTNEAVLTCNPFGICLFLMIMLATTLNTFGLLYLRPGINASSRALIKNKVFIVYRCARRCISQVLFIGVNSSERLCVVLQCECVSHSMSAPQVCVSSCQTLFWRASV